MTSRRQFLALAGTALASTAAVRLDASPHSALANALGTACRGLERRLPARLGVAVLDTATGDRFLHRGQERFPMCSSFKLLACSAVLARCDAGKESLDRVVRFSKADLQPYSPVTAAYAGRGGLSLGALCAAAMTQSDNTAANLILASLGGPAQVTRFVRLLGDPMTRLDRREPELNTAIPGDPRDTTTPEAMATDVAALALGHLRSGRSLVLSDHSRSQLVAWMLACQTGSHRLRAGVPPSWREGDKTGSGANGTSNDVAIFWPLQRGAIVAAVYLTESSASAADRDAAIAALGRALAGAIKPVPPR